MAWNFLVDLAFVSDLLQYASGFLYQPYFVDAVL